MKNILFVGVLVGTLGVAAGASAVDWPQYRADAARSGYSPETLPRELHPAWTYKPSHPPQPAWQGVDLRMAFDHAYHVAVANGMLFFGSSADGKVYALDAATGEPRWSFFTGAPVRFAPAVWRDRVLVTSDDGMVYCLEAADGALLWRKRGGPEPDMLLGNDRMVSRWPVRGGVAVAGDTVYFGAGIWPTEGIFLYALAPDTGEVRWCNDRSGGIYMPQPHGTAEAESGISVQGFLAVAGEHLLVPTGRAVPAAFSRAKGELEYFHLQEYGKLGGAAVVASPDYFIQSGRLFKTATGTVAATLGSTAAVAISPKYVGCAERGTLSAIDAAQPMVEKETFDRKGNPVTKVSLAAPRWEYELPSRDTDELILVGDCAVAGLASGQVLAVEANGEGGANLVWRVQVDGRPLGLAFADGRLYVSTDTGAIHCFSAEPAKPPRTIEQKNATPRQAPDAAELAREVLAQAGMAEGYCLNAGCGDGALALELARHSDFYVCAVDDDPDAVRAARKRLDAAGLLGVRAAVHEAPLDALPYAPYFADLVVAARTLPEPALEAARRCARPCGGVVCVGVPDAMAITVRGPLEGAADWTHQYATPANTCASGDGLVRPPLSMLWFRDSDFEMPSRHGRGPAPLYRDGRLFVEEMHKLRALNAYNGRTLWEFPLHGILEPYDQEHLVGTAVTGSNFCMAGDELFVAVKSHCLVLGAANGELLRKYPAPKVEEEPRPTWGFLARAGELLYGSVANTKHIVHWAYQPGDMDQLFSESRLLFALDAETGEERWRFQPEHSIRHNTIAIGGGRVYLIDRPLARGDRLKAAEPVEQPPGDLLALDAATGEVLWRVEAVTGTLLALSNEHDVLLMTQQHTRFKLPSEKGGHMTAFRASNGERLWNAPSDPQGKASRPLLIGKVVYNEPGAWDLMTGERLDFHLTRSYGCGIMAGCPGMLIYRSATVGYAGLDDFTGTENYGGIRPGCWINAIPAGGIVSMPDATHRCTCSYLMRANVAFLPAAE